MEFSWSMVGAISTIITVIGIFALLWLRSQLSKDFTPNSAFKSLADKVSAMEHDLRTAPTHRDITALGERVRAVEVAVAEVQATVASMKEGMQRIDRNVTRVVDHLLEDKK
jgi:hypothetical protein